LPAPVGQIVVAVAACKRVVAEAAIQDIGEHCGQSRRGRSGDVEHDRAVEPLERDEGVDVAVEGCDGDAFGLRALGVAAAVGEQFERELGDCVSSRSPLSNTRLPAAS
jgi:hypothetical protein